MGLLLFRTGRTGHSMRLHGSHPLRLGTPDGGIDAEADAARERAAGGYRNLFGSPDPADLFTGYGFGTPAQISETTRILDAVAYRMGCPYPWQHKLGEDAAIWENPQLPSGYTYLAQLVAHDMTFVRSARPQIPDPLNDERNFRGARLELDSIYGASVAERPNAYCAARVPSSRSQERTRMRLGYYNDAKSAGQFSDQQNRRRARDVPRIDPDFRNDTAEGMTDTLLADPRNDDQPIIAQIFVVFALLHNAACDLLEAADPKIIERHGGMLSAARRATRAVYRLIVEKDLLRQLLNKDVYRRYATNKAPLLDDHADGRLPVEFSHAAFRFGHAMVRPHYSFSHRTVTEPFGLRETLKQNSSVRASEMPLKSVWIIQWSHFFAMQGHRPTNLSRRLGPEFSTVLVDDAAFEKMSLARRDLFRGASNMRSVKSLIKELQARGVDLPEFLKSPSARERAVRDWLARPFCNHPLLEGIPLSETDIGVLAADPPLLLFILLEAALTEQGERLGFLGSIILAETLFAALREGAGPNASELLNLVYQGQVPDSMEKLTTFLEARYQFGMSGVPFV